MSALTEISLTSMKAAFPAAPDPIQGILADTEDTGLSHNEHVVLCCLYFFFTNEAYPTNFFPFLAEVDSIPDFSACNSDNERETLKATNARDQKTRADIVTMNVSGWIPRYSEGYPGF